MKITYVFQLYALEEDIISLNVFFFSTLNRLRTIRCNTTEQLQNCRTVLKMASQVES